MYGTVTHSRATHPSTEDQKEHKRETVEKEGFCPISPSFFTPPAHQHSFWLDFSLWGRREERKEKGEKKGRKEGAPSVFFFLLFSPFCGWGPAIQLPSDQEQDG